MRTSVCRFAGAFVLGSLFLVLPLAAQTPVDLPDPPAPPTPPEMSAEQVEVKEVVDRFGRMWEDEDMVTFDEVIARDSNMVIIGTDTAEYIVGYESFRALREQQYASFDNVDFHVTDQHIGVSSNGMAAWFTERFDLYTVAEGRSITLKNLRLSGVLEKRDGTWKIVQLHTSVPVAGQAAAYD